MSDGDGSSEESSEQMLSALLLVFSTLLSLVLVLGKALHNRPKLNKILSEPGMTLLVGIFVSFVIRAFLWTEDLIMGVDQENEEDSNYGYQVLLSFPNDLFFLGLLPPILFNSGFELQRELFFRHIKAIMSFATVGTAVAGFSAGYMLYGIRELGWFGDFSPTLLELLTFGALIAATVSII